jgi:cytochrome c-type biogenesis protein CcmH/NrfG
MPAGRDSSGDREPFVLRIAFGLAVAVLFWSALGGTTYFFSVNRSLPLQLDPLFEARMRVRKGDVAGALRQYRVYTRLRPVDGAALREMGEVAAATGQVAEAIRAFEAAVRLDGGDERVEARLLELHKIQERRTDAAAAPYGVSYPGR